MYTNKENYNEVRQSMISTVSQAFEFEDFLGETTVLKDRVPKNKKNAENKKIVYFSRDVGEEFAPLNPLENRNWTQNIEKKSTFEDYMNWDYKTPSKEASGYKLDLGTQYKTEESAAYQPSAYAYTDPGKYLNNVYGRQSSSNSSLNFRDKNPSFPNTYTSKYSPSFDNGYSSYNYSHQYPQNDSNYGYSYNSQSSTYPSQPSTYCSTYTPEPVISSNTNTYTPVSNQNLYNSRSYDASPQPVATPSSSYSGGKQNDMFSKKYEDYGEYAKDFSSPAIMAILKKRAQKNDTNAASY